MFLAYVSDDFKTKKNMQEMLFLNMLYKFSIFFFSIFFTEGLTPLPLSRPSGPRMLLDWGP